MKKLYILLFSAIFFLSNHAISQDSITISNVPTSLCANESLTINYTISGPAFTGTIQFQLSDALGSFALPTVLSSEVLTSTNSGYAYITIPASTPISGTSTYKIRGYNTGYLNNVSNDILINCTTRDYYWTGGTGNWSDLNNWEYDDGFTTTDPADVLPTTNDNVYFDDLSFPNSGNQLTIDVDAYCNDFYMDPLAGTNNPVLWADYSTSLNVSGDFELAPGVYRDIYYINFYPDKYNIYLYFGDNLWQADPNTYWRTNLYFYNSFNYELDSDINNANQVYVSMGSGGIFNTNDYQITTFNRIANYGSGTFNCGSSIITARGINGYGTLFDASAADIYLQPDENGNSPYLNGAVTHNNVTIDGGLCTIGDNNTYNNLSLINGGGISLPGGSIQTINTSFSALGTDRSKMAVIKSQQPGNTATIDILNGTLSVTADFVRISDNIILNSGAAASFAATNAVDGGNNTNWVFSTLSPLEYYWTGGSGNWSDASHWMTSSDGGTTLVAAPSPPALIDNVYFTGQSNPNGASFPAGGTITIDQEVTVNNVTWEPGSGATQPEFYGDWDNYFTILGDLTMADGVSRRINRLVFDSSNGQNNIDMADNYNAYGDTSFKGGGIANLLGDLVIGASLFIEDATLNTNNHTITVTYGFQVSSDLSVINFGSSNVYLYDGFANYATTPTLNFGTSILYFEDPNWRTYIDGSSTDFGNVVISYECQISSDNTFQTLTVNPGGILNLNAGTTQTINNSGTLNLIGTRSQLVNIEMYNGVAPSVGTLVVNGATVNADFVSIKDNIIDNGLAAAVNATNAVDNGNITGWNISAIVPLDFYWTGGTGNWSEVAHWLNPDGGGGFMPATDAPGTVDNVFFTANSFTSGGTVTVDTEIHINNMTWEPGSGGTFPSIFANYNERVYISGSLQMADGVNRNISRLIFDSDKTGNTINMADNIFNWGDTDFQGTGDWTLHSDLTTAYLNLRSGTLNTAGYTIDIFQQLYIANDVGVSNWGASQVNLSSIDNYSDGINMVFNAGTSTFIFDPDGGTSYVQGGNPLTFYDVVINKEAYIRNVDFTFNNLTFAPGSEVKLGSGKTYTVNGAFTAIGTRSKLVEISSTSSGSPANLIINTFSGGATTNVEFSRIKDINLDNGSAYTTLELANKSVDLGGNTGWDFLTNPLTSLDFYWIGGTGNWSDLSHWATTDGGSTLHTEAPGIIDNVFFTSSSFPTGGEITLDQPAACNNMTWNDGSFNPTIRGNYTNRLTIGGNLTIAAGVNRYLEYIEFNSTTTNQITLGDNRREYDNFIFRGTGTWNLIDDLVAGNIDIYGGTLNSNNNAITLDWDFNIRDDDPITLNFGSSEIQAANVNNWNYSMTAIVDVGTSNFTILDNGRFGGNPMEFYDITLKGEGFVYTDLGATNNFTILPGGTLSVASGKTLTVGNLIANGTRPSPVTIKSTQEGQAGTISQATGTVSASHIILKDNTATGGATFNAIDAYDKGNINGWNITPITGLSYYWMAATGNWSDVSSWSLSDGTNVVPGTAPGPADNIFITTNSPINNGGIMTLDIPAICNNMTWSTGASAGAAISGDNDAPLTIHGSLTMAPGVTRDLSKLIFDTDAAQTIDMADNIGNQNLNLQFYGTGDWTLQNPLATSNLYLYGGTLFTNGHQVDVNYLSISQYGTYSPTLDLGSSDVYVNTIDGYNSTIIPGTSTLYFEEFSTIYNSWTFNNVEIDGEMWVYGDNTFNNLTLLPGSDVKFNESGTQTISQLTAVGLRSRPIFIGSTNPGTQAIILQSSGVVAGQYLTLQDNSALGGAAFSATNSVDNGNVTGWNVTPISPRNYFWVGGSGLWSEYDGHWSNTDGGTTFFDSSPGQLDNVNFTSNSFPSGGTITLDHPTYVNNMDWTGSTSAVTISHGDDWINNLTIGGSLTLANGVTRDVNIVFRSDAPGNTIFMADNLFTSTFTRFYGSGDWTLTGPFESTRTYFYGGTFNTNNFDFTSDYILLYNDNTSNWGSSNVTTWRFYNYLDNSSTFNSETSNFRFERTSGNYLRGDSRFFIAIFDGGVDFDGNNIFVNASQNEGQMRLNDNQAFNTLVLAGGTTISIWPGVTGTVSDALSLNGSESKPVVVNSLNEGEAGIFSVPPTGLVTATYVQLKDNTATGGASFVASNSSDFGNVTGWSGLLTGQTIDFGPLNDRQLADGAFDVGASSTSGLSVTFEITDGNATISGTTVTPTTSGLIGINALQGGNGTYGSANPVTRFIHIGSTGEPNELGTMKEAPMIIGQPDPYANDYFYSNVTVPSPWGTAVSSTGKLAIANGSRVLIWNQIPSSFSTPADVVVGHTDFDTDDSGSPSASVFYNGVASVVFTKDDKMLVSDSRGILIFNSIPTTNGASADVIIGQDDFTSTKTGAGANRLNGSIITVAYYDDPTEGEKLLVTDYTNSRVLVFNGIPTSNGASANIVIGQADFNSITSGTGAHQMYYPIGSTVAPDGKLFVGDFRNDRVLIFNSIPTTNGASADMLLGQVDFGLTEPGTGPTAFDGPSNISVSKDGKIAISDYYNHRVLIYNQMPADQTVAPDYVLGQPNFESNSINFNSISGRSMYYPMHVLWDKSNNLFVSELGNERVMLFGAADIDAPVASNANYPTTFIDGQLITGSVTLTDRSGIARADVWYRGISSSAPTNFTQAPLTNDGTSDIWTINDEFNPIGSGEKLGMEFYIEAIDGVGNSMSSSTTFANIEHSSGLSISNFGVVNTANSATPEVDYRMFSVPLDLNNKDAKTVFDEITGGTYDNKKLRIFSFPGGTGTAYNEYGSGFTNIDMGKGYFALASASANVSSGKGATRIDGNNPFSITLVPGWNMIGNPFNFNVLWADVLAESGLTAAQAQTPQGYNGSYSDQPVLNTGEGFFVNNPTTGNVTLSIPVVYNSAAGRITGVQDNTNSLADKSWEVRFLQSDINGYDVLLGAVGMEENSIQSFDEHDRINPPAFAEQPKIEFNHPEFFQPSFKKDVRTSSDSEQWSFTYTAKPSDDLDEIYWDNSYYGYSSPDIYLVDKTNFKVINMKEFDTYEFKHAGVTNFEVHYGMNALEALLPDQLAVQTPFPNPFTEQININVGLPKADKDYKVIVAVYNTLGKQVATLTNGALDSGYYSFKWNGTNDSGNEVPNGIYAFRVMVKGSLSEVVAGKIMKE